MTTHRIQIRDLQDMLLPIDRHRPVEVCIKDGIQNDWYCFIEKAEYSCGSARLICIPDGELKTTKEEELDQRCDELIDAQERLLELLNRFDDVIKDRDYSKELDNELLNKLAVDVREELAKEH